MKERDPSGSMKIKSELDEERKKLGIKLILFFLNDQTKKSIIT